MSDARLRLFSVLLAAVGGCRGQSEPTPATAIHLVVAGGPHAGTYDVTSRELTCSRGLVGPGSWGNQYLDQHHRTPLASVQLLVPHAARAADELYLGLVFGRFFDGPDDEIESRPEAIRHRGHGRVTVEDHDTSGILTVEGATAESVGIQATISCNRIRRIGTPDSAPQTGTPLRAELPQTTWRSQFSSAPRGGMTP